MGQYYHPIILAENSDNGKEIIRIYLYTWNYVCGSKLMEHAYTDADVMKAFEYLLTPEGMFYKSRVVWAGDYADEEEDGKNLYHKCNEDKLLMPPVKDTSMYKYIVNHTKKQYISKENREIHPLPLLTAEGNGMGGGDYRGSNEMEVGSWARDCISLEKEIPIGFEELTLVFEEY
jgi:hypothetical protein